MMTFSKLHLVFSTGRKILILFYNLVVLSSLIATAMRDLHCDIGGMPVDPDEFSPMQIRPTNMAKSNETWRRRMLYAAAAVASSSRKYPTAEGRRIPQPNFSTFQAHDQFGRSSTTSSTHDYSIISETCGGDHGLEIQQDNTTYYFEGLPVYHVTMINTCVDCSLQDIHIACGEWASATEVNPLVFKRVADNDCVVNDGKPIPSQGAVIFEYTNSFPYPMEVQRSSPSCA